jgi:hypothetical protein
MSAATATMPPGVGGPDEADLRQADLPPVAVLGTLTLALTLAGGIIMAAQYGRHTSLIAPTVLAGAAGLVLVVNVILLARVREFAWPVFFRVYGWTLLSSCSSTTTPPPTRWPCSPPCWPCSQWTSR